MEQGGHTVLYAKNIHGKMPIASTTKIMTALLTLEAACKSNKTVTITDGMVKVEGSSMGLRAGNRIKLRSLAEGMLAVSGNDAANSAATAVGGSLDAFAGMMNEKARALGMNDTHYVTPSGLDDKNHYSSAYDLALLASYAMENKDFADIVGKKTIKVHFESPDETRTYKNHNKLLSMYGGCSGVKTGFTKKSGRCLVSSAEKDGISVIAVTLSDPCDWDDHKKLLDYGFSKLESVKTDDTSFSASVPVAGGLKNTVRVSGAEGENIVVVRENRQNLKRSVQLPRFVYAPVKKGEVLGSVRYALNGKVVAENELTANENIDYKHLQKNFFAKMKDKIKFGLFSR
jgi:D-alanyl-D-alanine carboxypeptidase/D-alanyl-D-alanine carboxypeptidase (penicillin-binding protein 5/6)